MPPFSCLQNEGNYALAHRGVVRINVLMCVKNLLLMTALAKLIKLTLEVRVGKQRSNIANDIKE